MDDPSFLDLSDDEDSLHFTSHQSIQQDPTQDPANLRVSAPKIASGPNEASMSFSIEPKTSVNDGGVDSGHQNVEAASTGQIPKTPSECMQDAERNVEGSAIHDRRRRPRLEINEQVWAEFV